MDGVVDGWSGGVVKGWSDGGMEWWKDRMVKRWRYSDHLRIEMSSRV